jgi:molybdate transport system substrate-binding protein
MYHDSEETAPMHKRITAPLAAFVFTFSLSQIASAQDKEVRIMCSNGFRAAMEKLMPESELAARGIKIQFGASANFKNSIEGGEPFDLVIVTPQIIADLTKEGKIAAGTSVDLASSGVGLAIRAGLPKPDVANAPTMKQTLLAAKSVGYVKVGAGTPAILDTLNGLGISNDVQSKTVFQPGAEESMANVASGKVDVAFALISEIVPAPGVQLAGPLPLEYQKRIIMTAGIASSSKNRDAVNGIIKSLTSAAAAPAIKAAGMDQITK